MNCYWYIFSNWSPCLIQITFVFYLMYFFYSRILSRTPSHINCQVSLGSSRLWQFLRLSLLLVALTVLRSAGQVFYRLSVSWNLSDIFKAGLWSLGGRPQLEMPSSLHHIKGIYYQCDLLPMLMHYFLMYIF